MKGTLLFLFGIFLGSWFSWPGITSFENWECFAKIINNSQNDKLSFKAVFSISPKILFQTDAPSKLRIVGDACFR